MLPNVFLIVYKKIWISKVPVTIVYWEYWCTTTGVCLRRYSTNSNVVTELILIIVTKR